MESEQVFDQLKHTGIYIVDRKTLETYYENPTAQKVSVKNRIGKPCYSIHGNTSMCSSCPIRNENRTSFVNRADLNMIFIVQYEEIEWKGHEAYLITVKKHEDLPHMSEKEKSINRMGRALRKSINVYTEINLETMKYRQINIQNADRYTALPEGDYAPAYEAMCADEIAEEDVEAVRKAMSPEILQALGSTSDGPQEITARYHLKDDTSGVLMQSRAIFMRDELPHYAVVVVTDVTKEMRMQEELKAALLNAQRADEAKTSFFSSMSHDMRTPMNGILGIARLSKDEEDISVLKENMEEIENSGEYLLSLINDTLDFQRIESGKLQLNPEIISCRELMDGIAQIAAPSAQKKNIDFQLHNRNMVLDYFVRADQLRVKQIFINLISNAIKFTPEGGAVIVESECKERDDAVSHVCFYIHDTGIGMSEDFVQNKMFKPFSQEHNDVTGQYAGSGLGLSIVKRLVELMGGTIEAKSEPGEGSTFILRLDFERVDAKEAKIKIQNKGQISDKLIGELKGRRILLVEDHPLNAQITTKILEKAGCFVDWANDGQKSVELLFDSPENYYDAVLMDIRMPVMNGLEAARIIRSSDRMQKTYRLLLQQQMPTRMILENQSRPG